jgi:thiamine biosynthesis protein ThiS
MKAYYDRDKKEHEFKAKTVEGMLKELNILSNTVVVSVNKELVTSDYKIQEEDEVKILSVVSGG